MSISISSDSSISKQVHNIVTGIVRGLVEDAEAKRIESPDDLDSATWDAVDNQECVTYTYQAKLVATEADWDEFRFEYGAAFITPERLAFQHLLSEVQGAAGYQELIEELERGETD